MAAFAGRRGRLMSYFPVKQFPALFLSPSCVCFHVVEGQGHAVPGPPPRAEVHRRALQGQEAQPDYRVHRGGHAKGLHPRYCELKAAGASPPLQQQQQQQHKRRPSVVTEKSPVPCGRRADLK